MGLIIPFFFFDNEVGYALVSISLICLPIR
nr:MAG TPA: glyceraldehyde-3-phosphate dehydrogenase [Caudoviricetes sp.]